MVPERLQATRPEVLTCQAMWEIIGRERIHVVIPYATRIEFQTKTQPQEPGDVLLAGQGPCDALLHAAGTVPDRGGGSYILATLDDFYAAARLFTLLNGTGGGQETKLTRRESELLTAVNQSKDCEFTIQQMQEKTNLSYNAIYSVLHGNQSRGQTYSRSPRQVPGDQLHRPDGRHGRGDRPECHGEGPMPTSSTMRCTASGRPADRSGSGGTTGMTGRDLPEQRSITEG